MHLRRVVAAVAVAFMSALAFAAPAAAAPSSTSMHPQVVSPSQQSNVASPMADKNCYGAITDDGGASACFVPYGEHLWVCDEKADGHHPGVVYWINGGSAHYADYDLGAGHCHDINLSIAESGYIDFYAVNYEKSTPLSYSPTVEVSANG